MKNRNSYHIKCKLLGHLPTDMTLSSPQDKNSYSQGFACWRCGVRLGWDGRDGFSELNDYKTGKLELVDADAFTHAKSQYLVKGKHWYSVTAEDNKQNQSKGMVTIGPLHPDDLPDWIKELEKKRE